MKFGGVSTNRGCGWQWLGRKPKSTNRVNGEGLKYVGRFKTFDKVTKLTKQEIITDLTSVVLLGWR